MRRSRLRCALFLGALISGAAPALGQSVANYAPVTRTTGITFSSISSSGSSLTAWRNGSSSDDNRSLPEPIGFTFYYDGLPYTNFSASLNGFLDLSASTASGAGNGPYGYANTQFSAPGGTLLTLAPLYDDLQRAASATLKSSVMYAVTGEAPDRVLTVEWIGLEAVGFPAADLNFQVKLNEADGRIEFIYGALIGGGAAYSYSCGINGPSMSAVPTAEQLLTQQTANTALFGRTPQNALSALPASSSMLQFAPVEHQTPQEPALITFADVTQTSMTVGWTDSSATETYFVLYRSADGVSFDQVASVASTTTAGSGGTYSVAQSGLIPGTTYHFRITANNEASAPSGFLTGSQPILPPGAVASVASGEWSDPAAWSSGAIPLATDNVTISDGDTITVDTAAVCLSLTVGQGASGLLRYEAAAARTLTAVLGVTVASGAAFTSAASGTQAGHSLVLGGGLLNDGTLDFSTSANAAGASIVFTGAGTAVFGGAGAITDLRSLTVNKGTSTASVLELSPAALTVRGAATDVASFVTLTNGTLRIAGAFAMTNRLFAPAAYTIPATAGLWLDNPSFTVAAQSAANAVVNGLLRITRGTYNVGTASGMSLGAGVGAVIQVEGGELSVAGRLSTTAAMNYLQTGGAVRVCTIGNTASGSGSFELASTAAVFSVDGGEIVLSRASTAASGQLDYKVSAPLTGTGGGTLRIGSAASAPSSNFRIVGAMPRLLVDDAGGPKTATLFSSIPAPQANEVVVRPGCTLNLNGFTLTVRGATVTNDGVISGATAGSRLQFQGSSPQTYSGSGAASMDVLAVDNPAGVTMDAALASNLVTARANLVRGPVTNSHKLTLGNGGANPVIVQIGAPALMSAGGSFDAQPALNLGAGGYEILYLTESAARTTGFEIPATRAASRLTVDNTNSVTLAGGGLTLTAGLTLTTGLFHTGGSSLLTLASTIASPPTGSSSSYVDGPLAIVIVAASPVTRSFAVGRGGKFRPLVLKNVNTGGVSRVFTAEVTDEAPGGTPVPPLSTLDPARYWRIGGSSALDAGARVNLAFGADDGVTDPANSRVAQSAAPAGSFASLGGTATGGPSAGTVESTRSLTPGDDYFTVAIEIPPVTWDGGAGTSSWGDPLNWSNDAVPDSTTRVALSAASPVTIDVNGVFACRDLSVGVGITLNLLSNALTVAGVYDQTGGAVHVANGSLVVRDDAHLSGGTFDIDAGGASAAGATAFSGAAVALVSGAFLAGGDLTLSAGSISLGSGTLEVRGAFAAPGGTFSPGGGTTLFSGTGPQSIGGGVAHYNLVLRGGGAQGKTLSAGAAFAIANDFTVESTAQLGVSVASPTTMTVGGNLLCGGVTGGANIASLAIQLNGVGKTIGGSAAKAAPGARADLPRHGTYGEREVRWLTDPAAAAVAAPAGPEGKSLLELENTIEKRRADLDRLLAETSLAERLVADLDDVTITRNPSSFAQLWTAASAFEMSVTVASGASYSLSDDIAVAGGRVLSILGRLDCGPWRIGGAGGVSLASAGTLGTGSTDPTGLGGSLVNTGANSFASGCIVEYNAAANQTIDPARHPSAAMIYTAGSGTKSLSGNKTITASSGAALTKGALVVGPGSTFADGGHLLTFTTPGWANVIVNGAYASSASGGISFESGPFYSNILAADGTAFGDLRMNFQSSVLTIDLNAAGAANLTFRNILFGGSAGTGIAGGTLRLNESGTTNVTVTGDVVIAPVDPARTGGGFDGTAPAAGLVTVLGDLISTSTAAVQPVMGASGPNVLALGGASPQAFTLAAGATVFSGATLRVTNPAGVVLEGSGLDYTMGGTLRLAGGNVVTGANTLAIASGGAIVRTAGHVVGPLRKPVPAGAGVDVAFEIGTGGDYTPVNVRFGAVASGGALTASAAAGDHPSVAASGIDPDRSVNRVYSLANSGAAFDACDATFHFVPADLDPAADPAAFIVRRWAAPDWYPTDAGARTATSTQATGLTAFGEFAVGEERSYLIHASADSGGTIGPSGSVLVPPGGSPTFSIAPDSCHYVAYVLVDGASVGAVTSYTFADVHANHTIYASFGWRLFTIIPSAGPGGSIAPAEPVVVNCGADQRFDVAADSCYHVADVLVDGNSIGPVTSYTFQNVTADRTISASFALDVFTVTASAGPGGAVSPAGAIPVGCGDSLQVAVTPDSCHVIADVVVDGGSVGPVTGYTFTGVTSNQTIAASFAPIVFTVTTTAGPGGSISPSGAVPVNCGDDRGFAITPEPGFGVASVRVDGDSIGPVTDYTFTDVTANHTIEASFVLIADNVITLAPPPECISTAQPCVEVPVMLYRTDVTPLRGFSITLALSPELQLCSAGPGLTEGDYLSAGGPTAFQVVDNGGGSYTADCALLGWPCGPNGASGELFVLRVENSGGDGSGSIDLTELILRDCGNNDVICAGGPIASIEIDRTPPAAIASLAAVQVKTQNDSDGTTKIALTFAAPGDAAAVEVYRAPFGAGAVNAYPEYDDIVGAGEPAAPSHPPGAPWALTGVTESGLADETGERGFWYYVAFAKDACGNVSPASGRTDGTLNYHLGDTHDTVTDCAGDNIVLTSDVSFLGAQYGDTLAFADPRACLDVGPTTDLSTDARPTTDNVLDFEDLMMFTLNYAVFSSPGGPPQASDEVIIEAPARVNSDETFDVTLRGLGTGRLRGVSFRLSWNAAIVAPVSAAGGELLARNGGVAYSPGPGALDAGVLAVTGLLGDGVLATVSFHASGTGDPLIAMAMIEGRDEENATVEIGSSVVGAAAPETPRAVELLPCVPNPFNPVATIPFRLPRRSDVELAIFAVDGRLVRVLARGPREAGEHRAVWDGRDERGLPVSSGVYFARLRAAGVTHTRGLTLLK